jgi:hypothetical protein
MDTNMNRKVEDNPATTDKPRGELVAKLFIDVDSKVTEQLFDSLKTYDERKNEEGGSIHVSGQIKGAAENGIRTGKDGIPYAVIVDGKKVSGWFRKGVNDKGQKYVSITLKYFETAKDVEIEGYKARIAALEAAAAK